MAGEASAEVKGTSVVVKWVEVKPSVIVQFFFPNKGRLYQFFKKKNSLHFLKNFPF